MRILFLTSNDITYPLYDWLVSQQEDVSLCKEKIAVKDILARKIEFIVSYNYRFLIKPDIISMLPHRVINLHISYLPWNRGASPNLWSFLENTPCGVTIHEIDSGLDTGDILVQKMVDFDYQKETLKSAYEKSHITIQRLFQNYWQQIKNGTLSPKRQEGQGSFHLSTDLTPYTHLINYDDYIEVFIQKVRENGK